MSRSGQSGTNPPTARQLIAIVRSLAEDPKLAILQHARERMVQRDITIFDIERVLRLGDIVGPIVAGRIAGEWTCKIVHAPRYPEDGRDMGVVTIVVGAKQLLIKTVEWELKP
jgi:hypothetical protein